MATDIEAIEQNAGSIPLDVRQAAECREAGETKLLLQAFELFTNASSSLESAFVQLQAHAQKLTEELAKGRLYLWWD